VPLTEADRLVLVQFGLPIKARLAEVISIAKPETLLGEETSDVLVMATDFSPPVKPEPGLTKGGRFV
jgi:hypothetical protein